VLSGAEAIVARRGVVLLVLRSGSGKLCDDGMISEGSSSI
jgi:hypothetical protein